MVSFLSQLREVHGLAAAECATHAPVSSKNNTNPTSTMLRAKCYHKMTLYHSTTHFHTIFTTVAIRTLFCCLFSLLILCPHSKEEGKMAREPAQCDASVIRRGGRRENQHLPPRVNRCHTYNSTLSSAQNGTIPLLDSHQSSSDDTRSRLPRQIRDTCPFFFDSIPRQRL